MRFRISIDPLVYIWTAALVLLVPVKWLICGFLAAGFHEICHFIALQICHTKILKFTVHPTGAIIDAAPMSDIQELVCAAAGPFGSVFLLHFYPNLPELSVIGFAQGIFNLLPIHPLDGGRMVSAFLNMIFPAKAGKISFWISILVTSLLTVFCFAVGIFPGIILFGKLGMDLWKKNSLQRGVSRCTI